MAKKYSRRHKRNRKMRGGYSSASTYGTYVNGSPDSQFNRVFDQSGIYGKMQGNTLIGTQGQNVVPVSQIPTNTELSLVQKAGKKHKKGGFLGNVINQAIVPFGILGMQQTFRRKKGGKKCNTRKLKY